MAQACLGQEWPRQGADSKALWASWACRTAWPGSGACAILQEVSRTHQRMLGSLYRGLQSTMNWFMRHMDKVTVEKGRGWCHLVSEEEAQSWEAAGVFGLESRSVLL